MKKERRLHTEFEAWLRAEAIGDDAGAEAAFAALVEALPRLGPSPGFAERVVWAAIPATQAAPVWLAWLLRGSLVAALTLVAMATGFLPAVARLWPGVPGLARIAGGVADAASWLGRRFEAGLEVWALLGRIGDAFALALGTPEAQTALAGSVVLATVAFYTLHHLLTFERRIVR